MAQTLDLDLDLALALYENVPLKGSASLENVPIEIRIESINALKSVVSKSEKALAQMSAKGSNITLLKKRLKALVVGLSALDQAWNNVHHRFTWKEISEARQVLFDLLPQLKSALDRQVPGSPQRTLLKRRIKAVELSILALSKVLHG